MASIQDLVLTFCPKLHCFTTKETETLDACIAIEMFNLQQSPSQCEGSLLEFVLQTKLIGT